MSQELQNQVAQHKQAIDGLLCQLDATKQMFNETMNSNLQLRTQCISLNKMLQEANKQLADANAKVAELSPKPEEVPPAV